MVDRRSPLAGLAGAAPSIPAVRLVALPPCARVVLRTAAVLDLPIVQDINRAVVAGGVASLRLGPDEWLILAPDAGPIFAAASDHAAAVVDVSHRQVAIEIAGPRAAEVLNGHCALDLGAAFPPGMCTRTLLGKAEIVLWRTGADEFHLEVGRSFAPYVWQCLEEGRREHA